MKKFVIVILSILIRQYCWSQVPNLLGPDYPVSTNSNLGLQENAIAICPRDPNWLFSLNNAVYNGALPPNSGVAPFSSYTGGTSWAPQADDQNGAYNGFLYGIPFGGPVDPSVVMDSYKNVYGAFISSNEVIFLKADFDGNNFPDYYKSSTVITTPIPNTSGADRTNIQITDNVLLHASDLYLGWRGNTSPTPALPYVSYSGDLGTTWTTPYNLVDPSTGFVPPPGISIKQHQSINIASGVDGKAYAAWIIIAGTGAGSPKYMGFSWFDSPIFNASPTWHSKVLPFTFSGVMPFAVSIAVDHQNEDIYLCFANNGAPCDPTNNPANCNTGATGIYFTKSSDNGNTWSTPLMINTPVVLGGTYGYVLPRLACDPYTGLLGAVYYKSDAQGHMFETHLSISETRGHNWLSAMINDQPFFNGNSSPLWSSNDYIDIKIVNNWVVPIWTDARTGNPRAYTQPFLYTVRNNITIPDPLTNQETPFYAIHKANTDIQTNQNTGYECGAHINMYAGNSIHLLNGFHSGNPNPTYGNWFHAHIQTTPNAFNSGERKKNPQESNEFNLLANSSSFNSSRVTAYPNPTSDFINISYTSPNNDNVTIVLYDEYGRILKKLVDNAFVSQGTYFYELNVEKEGLPSGILFCHVFANDFSKTIKLSILDK